MSHKQGHSSNAGYLLRPRGRQSEAVYFSPHKDLVVLGTAGTGKSVMAVLRARYLADPLGSNPGPVLLVTYNNALTRYLHHVSGGPSSLVTVETYGKFARGYLHSIGKMPNTGAFADGENLRALVRISVNSVRDMYKPSTFFERDLGFFLDELSWISSMGIVTEAEYLTADRLGRSAGLDIPHRQVIWKIRTEYLAERVKSGYKYDWDDVATAVIQGASEDARERKYKHVVIDEGQDLSPEAIRSLKALVQPGGTVSFFGDYHQQIYGQGMSFKQCGLNIKAVQRYVENYRNTNDIARIAIAMNSMVHMKEDAEHLVEPKEPKAMGIKPTLVACADESTEIAMIQSIARDQGTAGTVAILARTHALAARAVQALAAEMGVQQVRPLMDNRAVWNPSPGIYYGTYHAAKGLEFDVVLLPFCSANRLPHGEVVTAYGDESALSREGKLLYVAITRAKAELTVTYTQSATELIPRHEGLWKEISL